MTTRTIRDVGGPRAYRGGWRKLGVLGLALVLPGGLVLLLLLIARSRTRAASVVGDPYVDWLRMRERLRSDRPAAGTPGRSVRSQALGPTCRWHTRPRAERRS